MTRDVFHAQHCGPIGDQYSLDGRHEVCHCFAFDEGMRHAERGVREALKSALDLVCLRVYANEASVSCGDRVSRWPCDNCRISFEAGKALEGLEKDSDDVYEPGV